MDADLASNKLNELFHLHRYEDCVLFINRLGHVILKQVLNQLPVDMYLSRLPYTIEIFEALYAKMFILDAENFPVRTLQPERLIDKMICYFSLLNDQDEMEPIDGPKMLDSFENVIRIISYVQPNQYSRLLYFKYAIDRALLKFEKDLISYSKNLANLNEFLLHNLVANSSTLSSSMSAGAGAGAGLGCSSTLANTGRLIEFKKSLSNNYANALLISRASNIQTCETMRLELAKSINNCHKAMVKLNEYLANLKSQKLTKNIQSIVFSQSYDQATTATTAPASSGTGSLNCNSNPGGNGAPSGNNNASSAPTTRKNKRNNSVSNERSGSGGGANGKTLRSESVTNFSRNKTNAASAASPTCTETNQNWVILKKLKYLKICIQFPFPDFAEYNLKIEQLYLLFR